MERQTRIEFQPTVGAVHIDTTIHQPETDKKPWAVHVEGWTNGAKAITIYHEEIIREECTYTKCSIDNPEKFADFVKSQLMMFKVAFRKDIEFRAIDYQALIDGYERGVKQAGSVRTIEGH